jgi:hypothetical protein
VRLPVARFVADRLQLRLGPRLGGFGPRRVDLLGPLADLGQDADAIG